MHRHFWMWTVLLAVAMPAFGQDKQDAPVADDIHPQIRKALRSLRKSYRTLNQTLGNPASVANPGIERQIKSLDEMEEDFVAACKRIQVDPRAERASAAMRRSSYKRALRMLRLMLTAKPDDPYASYLAGMCAAELGQFKQGAAYFADVLKNEPTSHTSRLLSAYCKSAAKHKPPLSDETVLACFEAGLAETTKHVPPPETDDDDDFTARLLASVLSLPDILKDPLLYVLDNEALSGRGPRALDIDRFVAAAQQSNDTYELFLAWFSTADDEIAASIEERLDGPQHTTTMKALLFLIEYYGQDALFLQRGDKFEKQLAELRRLMPDEGLWLMLAIEQSKPDDDNYGFPPLNEKDFDLFESAVSSPRFTNYSYLITASAMRLMKRLRFPWARRAAKRLGWTIIRPQYSVLRDVGLRAKILAKKHFDSGDLQSGLRAAEAVRRFADQLEQDAGGIDGIGRLIRASYRQSAAELVIDNLPTSHTEMWLTNQRRRLEAKATTTRQSNVDLNYAASVIPVTAINDAENRLLDGEWPEWKLKRVSRAVDSDDGIESGRRRLTWALDGVSSIRTEYLLDPGILKRYKLLPELRRFRDVELNDDKLWPLVWTLGELEDKESIDWLIAQLSDPREWLKITAAEALRKITGLDHKLDQAAWKEELNKRP